MRPSEIHLSGVPPIMTIKTPNIYIDLKKKQKSKNTFRKMFIRGPPYNAYKNTRKKKVNIDLKKYIYQGSPL